MAFCQATEDPTHPTSAPTISVQWDPLKHRLNDEGKAIIKDFLDENFRVDKPISLELRKAAVKQVIGAGSSWFKMTNLVYYINQRQNKYVESHSANSSNKDNQQLGSDEEELLFGSIGNNIRRNLCWLFEAKIGSDSYPSWADILHISVDDIKSYFDWLGAGGKDVHESAQDPFSEIPFEKKEKLQSLLAGNPSATEERKRVWANRVEIRPKLALEYIRHLQENRPDRSRALVINHRKQRDQMRAGASLHLPTPVSLSPNPEIPLPPLSQPPAQRPSSSAMPIRTDRRHWTPEHTPYPQSRKPTASPEARAIIDTTTVKQEPSVSPVEQNKPLLFHHPLSAAPFSPGLSPAPDHASNTGQPLSSLSPSSTTKNHDVQLTRAFNAASIPPPECERERASPTDCGRVESTQGRQHSGSAWPIAVREQGNPAEALQGVASVTRAKQTLTAMASRIDDFKTGLEGVKTVYHKEKEEFVRAGGKLGSQAMDVDVDVARRRTSATADKTDNSHRNYDEKDVTMEEIDELANNAVEAKLTTSKSSSTRSPVEDSIEPGRSQGKADADVQDSHVQTTMDIELEPRPNNLHELLKWMDRHQGPLDMIISFGQQIKATAKA